jgi:hypothetical protein
MCLPQRFQAFSRFFVFLIRASNAEDDNAKIAWPEIEALGVTHAVISAYTVCTILFAAAIIMTPTVGTGLAYGAGLCIVIYLGAWAVATDRLLRLYSDRPWFWRGVLLPLTLLGALFVSRLEPQSYPRGLIVLFAGLGLQLLFSVMMIARAATPDTNTQRLRK